MHRKIDIDHHLCGAQLGVMGDLVSGIEHLQSQAVNQAGGLGYVHAMLGRNPCQYTTFGTK